MSNKGMGKGVVLIVMFLMFLFPSAFAELFSPINERYIETGQNSNWYYTQIHKITGNEYIGIDKNSRGAMGIGNDDEFFGRVWMIPAYKVGATWYLCPIKDVSGVNSVTDLNKGWFFDISDPSLTCYEYNNYGNTVNVDMSIELSFVTDNQAQTKININTTVSGASPTDTGFAFLFIPENANKFGKALINGVKTDLTGADGSLPVDKVFEFLDSSDNPIGHVFDWTDMLDTGNRFSEIVTFGGKKGLMVGTYGYGANATISIDPIYSVDYSPNPALHLIGGFYTSPNSGFDTVADITAGVSDNLSGTKYETLRDNLSVTTQFLMGYKFDETSGDTVADYYFANPVEMQLYGSPNLNIGGINGGSGINFDGNDDYGLRNRTTELTANESFLVCVSVNDDGTSATRTFIDNKGGGSAEGVELVLNPTDTISFFTRRTGTQTTLTSTTAVDDSSWHTVCGMSHANGSMALWIDGVIEDSATGITGSLTATEILHIGESHTGGNRFDQKLDELCVWGGETLSPELVVSEYNTSHCGEPKGKGINPKWAETYDGGYQWFLRVKKETAGDSLVTVAVYNSSDEVTNVTTTHSFLGVGWDNINVGSLMDYQLNNLSLNYTSFRFYTNITTEFSEIFLRQEANDTEAPSITNCQTDKTILSCGESAFLSCDVTDNSDVENVTFQIEGTNYTTIQNQSNYYYSFSPTAFGIYDWEQVYAYDILGSLNTTDPDINITYNCFVESITERPLNATGGYSTLNFTTDNLEEIEYLEINFTLNSGITLDDFRFNFTADGFSPCSLGNKQTSTCYDYDTPSTKWIEFVNNSETSTYDGTQGNLGDRIEVAVIGDILRFKIDEHYNPNVFKHYEAGYNFSDVKWQNGTDVRLNGTNDLIKIWVNKTNLPLNADQYKLDLRVQHNNPTKPLEAYFCNSSYTTGHPHNSSECVLVGVKEPSELQSVTKFRAIFTKDLINGLGDIQYVILEHHADDPSEFYAIKTYKATAPAYTTNWEYTDDGGQTWNNLGDGYETELNINWFFNGAEPTQFRYSLWVNETGGLENNFEGYVEWDIDPTNNYPPSVNIFDPLPNTEITIPHTITFSSFDPNSDSLNVSLFLYEGGIFNRTIASGLDENDNLYLWNDVTLPSGIYDIVLEACETATPDFFCDNLTATNINVSSSGCVEDWVAQFGACLTNDSQFKTYTDNASCGTVINLPFDNGTYTSCNYCSEDLEKTNLTSCYLFNGTGLVDFEWVDNNFFSCCSVTSIASDCSILSSPFNESSNESCALVLSEFTLELNNEVYFGFGWGGLKNSDKVTGRIFINNSNETHYCLSYAEDINGNVVQVNPAYSKRISGLVQLSPKEIEDREFFITVNGLSSVYWTDENLVIDGRNYIFGVECSDGNVKKTSEKIVTVLYESVNSPITRWYWLGDNVLAVVLFVIFLIVLVLFIGGLWYSLKKGR